MSVMGGEGAVMVEWSVKSVLLSLAAQQRSSTSAHNLSAIAHHAHRCCHLLLTMDPDALRRVCSNAEGQPFNAIEYVLQRADLVRRLQQSTRHQQQQRAQDASRAEDTGGARSSLAAVFLAEEGSSGEVRRLLRSCCGDDDGREREDTTAVLLQAMSCR
jgi:hypothetical protein